MNRNIELKARYANLDSARRVAHSIGAVLHAVECQRDTYFRVPVGRLKLRERRSLGGDRAAEPRHMGSTSDERPSQLIWYQRTDQGCARGSDYTLVEVPKGEELRDLLAAALGITAEVVKHRTVYLHGNVRIHLDQVTGLGNFIEFEAIVDNTCGDAAALAKHEHLRAAFQIDRPEVISGSYGDLIGMR